MVEHRERHLSMSLGQKLRQERERRGVTLADIAKETRISSRHLEAIETGDTKTMPRDFFYRSFVRQYATYLGMATSEVDAALDLEMGAPALAMAAAAGAEKATPVPSAPKFVPMATPSPVADVSPRVFLQESRTSLPWLALAGLLLVASVTYLAWDRVGGDAKRTASAEPAKAAVAQEVAAGQTVTTTTANGTTVQATKLPSGSLKLIISAKEPAWIQLDADGKPLFVGLLEAGQTREVDNAQQAKLLTGNAGGIQILQNGKQIPDLGSRGEVKTVVFDKEKYEVLRPVPPPKSETGEPKAETPKSDSPVAE